jgi:hypothetical protein
MGVRNPIVSRRTLERSAADGDSPVDENTRTPAGCLSTTGHEKSCGKQGGPPSKAQYSWRPIVNKYREGKVKSSPGGR